MEVEEGRLGVYQLLLMTRRWLKENPDVVDAIEEAMKGALKKLAQTVSLYEQDEIAEAALRSLRKVFLPPCIAAIEMEELPGYHNGVVDTKQGE